MARELILFLAYHRGIRILVCLKKNVMLMIAVDARLHTTGWILPTVSRLLTAYIDFVDIEMDYFSVPNTDSLLC